MAAPALPGGHHGQIDVGYAPLLEGLEQNGTAKGSMNLTAITDTNDDAFTFELASAGVGGGNLAGYIPLELHVRLWDGTTQVAGRWNTNLTGDSNTTTTHGVITASEFAIIPCFDIFMNDKTVYIKFTATPTAGQVEYRLVCARDRATA
jgi:hypothetical protein